MADTEIQLRRRQGDSGILCVIALRLSELWDFIDKRDIDKHFASFGILYGTWIITQWAMHFAEIHDSKTGIEIAAILGAVLVPWMALQGAALKWYFESRPTA